MTMSEDDLAKVDLAKGFPHQNVQILKCTCADYATARRMAQVINADSRTRLEKYYKDEKYEFDARVVRGIGRGCTIQELDDGSFAVEEEPDWDVLDAAQLSYASFEAVLWDIECAILRAVGRSDMTRTQEAVRARKLAAIVIERSSRLACVTDPRLKGPVLDLGVDGGRMHLQFPL